MTTTATAPKVRPGPSAVLDVGVAAAAVAGSLLLASRGSNGLSHSGSEVLDPTVLLLLLLASVPVVAWRRSPLGVFALTASAAVLLAVLDHPVGFPFGPTAALYFLAASRNEAHPWTSATTAAVVGLFVAYLGATFIADASFPGIALSHTSLAWTAAWFAGERRRLRQEQLAELRERATRAERDAERERLLAVAEERARIARDLHDSAGHAVNVIAVRAGAARLRHEREPHRSATALEAIEELARHTVEEIDQIVGTLRDRGTGRSEVEPAPGLASLDDLAAQHAAAGLEVTLSTAGSPRPLSSATGQATYRILQEALTNAARHGAGAATVELTFDDSAIDITVTNPLLAGSPTRSGGGHGIVGMSERATLLGGTLGAQRSNGEFRLHATIPYAGHAA